MEDEKVEDDDVEKEEDEDVEEDRVEEEDRSQDQGPHCVRAWACAVEMHYNISQEPFYTKRENAAPQTRGPHFVRACAVEMHCNMSQEPLHIRKFTGKRPQTRVSTLIKHRPLHLP